MNVLCICHIFSSIANASICKPSLPNLKLFFQFDFCFVGEAALDELHTSFQRHVVRRSEKQMKMIWHHHIGMQKIFALVPIFEERCDKRSSQRLRLKQLSFLICAGCNEVAL